MPLPTTNKFDRSLAHQEEMRQSSNPPIDPEFLKHATSIKEAHGLPDKIRESALVSKLTYKFNGVNDAKALQDEVAEITGKAPEPHQSEPFFECGLIHRRSEDVPIVWVAFYTLTSNDKGKDKKLSAHLYIGFKGSTSLEDWLTNFDGRPTNSNMHGILLHSGMFSVWNRNKDVVEELIQSFFEEGSRATKAGFQVELDSVVYTGHSLGGGIAQIFAFQMHAASAEDACWPRADYLRPSSEECDFQVQACTFAAPPVFVKEDHALPKEVEDNFVNVSMEFDMVPRLANLAFVKAAAQAFTKHMSDQSPVKCLPITNSIVSAFAGGMFEKIASTADGTLKSMEQFLHLGTLLVLSATPLPDYGWRCIVLEASEQDKFIQLPWPFPKSHGTKLALDDHTMLPSQILLEWRVDHCAENKAAVCIFHRDDIGESFNLVDCAICRKTMCSSCHGATHQAKKNNWHLHVVRHPDVKVRECSALALLESDVQKALKDMAWFQVVLKEEMKNVTCALNVFWACDLVKDIAVFVEQGAKGAVQTAGFTPAAAFISVGIAASKSMWLVYQRFFEGKIDSFEFWKALSSTWLECVGSIGGAFLGSMIGGAIGALAGPIGAAIGAILGGAAGALLGRAAGVAANEALFSYLEGADGPARDRCKYIMLAKALCELGVETLPSELSWNEVNMKFRAKIRDLHPDRVLNELLQTSEGNLTEKDKQQLEKATRDTQALQNNNEMAVGFVRNKSLWTVEEVDKYWKMLRQEYRKIEEDLEAEKVRKEGKVIQKAIAGYQ